MCRLYLAAREPPAHTHTTRHDVTSLMCLLRRTDNCSYTSMMLSVLRHVAPSAVITPCASAGEYSVSLLPCTHGHVVQLVNSQSQSVVCRQLSTATPVALYVNSGSVRERGTTEACGVCECTCKEARRSTARQPGMKQATRLYQRRTM